MLNLAERPVFSYFLGDDILVMQMASLEFLLMDLNTFYRAEVLLRVAGALMRYLSRWRSSLMPARRA